MERPRELRALALILLFLAAPGWSATCPTPLPGVHQRLAASMLPCRTSAVDNKILGNLLDYTYHAPIQAVGRGVQTTGNMARMKRFAGKVLAGQPVNLGVVGGSFSVGQSDSRPPGEPNGCVLLLLLHVSMWWLASIRASFCPRRRLDRELAPWAHACLVFHVRLRVAASRIQEPKVIALHAITIRAVQHLPRHRAGTSAALSHGSAE